MGAGSVMTVNPGATINLASATLASTIGTLNQNGSLALGTQNLNVTLDYDNANFGTGNSFAPRAGVTGAGQIVGVNAAQTLTGSVAAGGANTFTLAFGNVRGGTSSTLNYQVVNSGTGASIRGAVQTGAPGLGGITDGRLSGTGVTAANFGPIAAGANSGNLAVTLTAGATGGALSGQSVAAVSNFSNVSTQTLNISGFTTVLAQGSAAPAGPIDLGNFRVGQPLPSPTTLSVTNTTTGAGAERLGIGSVNATGNFAATNVLGTGFVAPGATQTGAVNITMPTGVVGINTGSATIQFVSNGQLIDASFVNQNVNAQTVNLQAQGFLVAQPALPASVNLGNFRAVQGTAATPFTIANTAVAPVGFQELLTTSAGATTGGVVLTGAISQLARGDSSSAMSVAFAASGTTGTRSGTATVNLVSDGQGTSGLGLLNLPSQSVTVNGTAFALAQANVPTGPINLGNFRVGTAPGQAISITNTLVAEGFQEGLDVAAGALTGTARIAGAPITNLAAGASSSAITLGLTALAAGNNTGTAVLDLASNGTGTSGLSTFTLPSSAPITINATGWNLAQAAPVTPSPVVLANQRVGVLGTALTSAITIANSAPAAFSETLNASFAGSTGNAITNAGSVTQLIAGSSNTTAMRVGLDNTVAGARSGSFTVGLVSDGTPVGNSGLGTTALTSQTINVSGNVFQVAQPNVPSAPINLGNFRVGAAPGQTISITNTLVAAGFQEGLDVSAGALTGAARIAGAPITNLAAGASSSAITLGLTALAAGNNTGTAVLSLASNGTGTSGLSTLVLASSAPITINATGWNLAAASVIPSPIVLANQRIGGALTQALTVANTAPAGSFTEGLNASFGSNSGNALNNGGSVSLLAGGANDSSAMVARLDTSAAGARSGTVTVNLVSDGTLSTLGNTSLTAQTVNVSGNVFQVAQATTVGTINLGNVRAGTSASQSVSITNTLLAAGFQEGLDVAVGALTGNASGTGSISNLAAGSSSSAIALGLTGITAGSNSASATLDRASNGTGTSGLSTLALAGNTVTINATGWNLAVASVTPSPIVLANQRIGGALTQALTVANTAPTGSFTEGLNASFGANSGNALNNGGSVSLLAGGANDSSAMVARLDTSAAGARSGTVTVNLVSDGTLSTLGNTSLAAQTVNVSGNVFQVAQPTTVGAINLGNVRAGTSASQSVSITNTLAAPAGFQEGLDVAIGALTGNASGTGSITNLGAGSSSSALSLGLSNLTAGNNSGTVTLDRASNGTVSGLANLALPGQQVSVSAVGWRLAEANAIAPVSFGSVRIGGVASAALAVTNTAAADGFSERLNASASTASAGLSATDSFNLLSPNSTNNTGLVVGIDTSTAGARSGTVAVALTSDGAGTSGLGQTALATQNVGVSGNVYQVAQPTLSTTAVNLGNFRAGSAQSQAVVISNPLLNATAAFQEGLNASTGATTGQATISGGPIVNLGAGAAGSNAISVGVSGVAGVNSGTATISFASNGTGTSGLSNLALASQQVTVQGTGYRLAQAGTVGPINFGNVLRNSVQERFVTISNSAIADGFSEGLDASFGAFGGTSAALLSGAGSVSNLAAGGSNGSAMRVVLNTVNTGLIGAGTTATINFTSNGTALGLGTTALVGQSFAVSGEIIANVGDLAQASAATPNPVNFGNFRVGSAAPSNVALSISNTGTGDGEGLNASIATASSGFSATGSFTSLARNGGTNNTSLQVGFSDTATAGAKSGTATITLASDGTFNGGTTTPLGTQVVGLNANVYQVAQAALPALVNFGNFRVGSAPAAQTVTIGNTLNAPAGFQEGLDASIGALTGAATASGGPIANLAAGSTSNAISVGITGVAGLNTGTVAVNLASNGSGTSGLATLGLPAGSINVSGQGFVAAAGTLNTANLNFGTIQVGQLVSQVLSITNSASGPAGFVEDLAAAFGTSTDARISGTGSISGLLGGGTNNSAMTVSVNTASAGAVNGSILVNYTSQGAVNGVNNGLGTLAVGSSSFGVTGTINANVVNTASPVVNNAQPINLGSVRVGATSPTAFVSLTNQSVGAPQAQLNATIAGNGAITASGAVTGLLPGQTSSNALQVGLNTATAGNFNGSTASLSLVSDASNIGNCAPNCLFDLPGQNITVNGKVYAPAIASVAPGVNFGIVRVGDVAVRGVSVANSAALTALNDTLTASIGGTGGAFSNNAGTVNGLI
ncbi:MAG: choice-of-anchor D domain-containing protein, partial [Pseudomonadota bacterium]